MKLNEKVDEVIESGIQPICLKYEKVRFSDGSLPLVRSLLVINSLDLGVLEYDQYRFVAARSKQGEQLVQTHIIKLMREINKTLEDGDKVTAYTIPVYARTLRDGVLAGMLYDGFGQFPKVPQDMICIEISADILFEDIDWLGDEIETLRTLGVKIALSEVGDEYCPVFRLSSVDFDYAMLDPEAVRAALSEKEESTLRWLVDFLRSRRARVIATGLHKEDEIDAVVSLGCDGYNDPASSDGEVV